MPLIWLHRFQAPHGIETLAVHGIFGWLLLLGVLEGMQTDAEGSGVTIAECMLEGL